MEGEVVPAAAIEAMERTLGDLGNFEEHFLRCLPLADPAVLAELSPLQRARVSLVFAKAATTLYTLRLRCSGIDPKEHPVKKEIERLEIYEEKLKQQCDRDKAPLQPSTTVNHQAAVRVIQHSLPDLTAEQRKKMLEVSKMERRRSKSSLKKRKHQSSQKPSVRDAAQEFLEKAMHELLGSSAGALKGPLRKDSSDGEDGQIN